MLLRSLQKLNITLILLVLLIFVSATKVRAQMFSVEDDNPVRVTRIPTTGIYVGLEPAEFNYKGSQNIPDPGVYEFDGSLLRLRLETPGFEAYLGVGGRITGIDDIGYFDAGAKAARRIRIVRDKFFNLQLPIQLKSSITMVSNDASLRAGNEFRQATFEFGAGGRFGLRFSNRIRFTQAVIPSYGFSFASGGIFGGQIFDLETASRFYFDRLFGDAGLSAGFDYNFKRFDVEDEEFDYNFRSFSFIIGITF